MMSREKIKAERKTVLLQTAGAHSGNPFRQLLKSVFGLKPSMERRALLRRFFMRLPMVLRLWVLRREVNVKPLAAEGITFKLATTMDELKEAFAILHDCYVREGYMKPHPSGLRCSIHHSLPFSSVLVAKHNDKVIATVTLIKDSPIGLPSDKEYKLENDKSRGQGFQLCEVSALATSPEYRKQHTVTFHLMKYLSIYSAEQLGTSMLVCIINPKALDFYKAYFNFQKNGHEISYQYVQGAKGIHISHDSTARKAWMKQQFSKEPSFRNLYQFWYHTESPFLFPKRSALCLVDPVLTPEMLTEIFAKQTEVLQSASPKELALVKSAYSLYFDTDLPQWKDLPFLTRTVSYLQKRAFRYHTHLKSEVFTATGPLVDGVITDISIDGLFLSTASNLDLTKTVRVLFHLPETTLDIVVQPTWCNRGQDKTRPLGYGCVLLTGVEEITDLLKTTHHNIQSA